MCSQKRAENETICSLSCAGIEKGTLHQIYEPTKELEAMKNKTLVERLICSDESGKANRQNIRI